MLAIRFTKTHSSIKPRGFFRNTSANQIWAKEKVYAGDLHQNRRTPKNPSSKSVHSQNRWTPKNPLSKSLTWPKSEFRPQAQAQVKNRCLGQNRETPKKHRKKIGFGPQRDLFFIVLVVFLQFFRAKKKDKVFLFLLLLPQHTTYVHN